MGNRKPTGAEHGGQSVIGNHALRITRRLRHDETQHRVFQHTGCAAQHLILPAFHVDLHDRSGKVPLADNIHPA